MRACARACVLASVVPTGQTCMACTSPTMTYHACMTTGACTCDVVSSVVVWYVCCVCAHTFDFFKFLTLNSLQLGIPPFVENQSR